MQQIRFSLYLYHSWAQANSQLFKPSFENSNYFKTCLKPIFPKHFTFTSYMNIHAIVFQFLFQFSSVSGVKFAQEN